MIDWNGKSFKTLSNEIYMGNKKITEIYMGNKKIYPTEEDPGELTTWLCDQPAIIVFDNRIQMLGSTDTKINKSYVSTINSKWSEIGILPIRAWYSKAAVKDNFIHLVDGKQHYIFSFNTGWKLVSSLPLNIWEYLFVVDGGLYAMHTKSGYTAMSKYSGGNWKIVSDNGPRVPGAAIVFNDELHIFGVRGNYTENARQHYIYNTLTNVWEKQADINRDIIGSYASVSYNNYVYMVSHNDGGLSKSFTLKWNPTDNSIVEIVPSNLNFGTNMSHSIIVYNNVIHRFVWGHHIVYEKTKHILLSNIITMNEIQIVDGVITDFYHYSSLSDSTYDAKLINDEWIYFDTTNQEYKPITSHVFRQHGILNGFSEDRWIKLVNGKWELVNDNYKQDDFYNDANNHAMYVTASNNSVYVFTRSSYRFARRWKWNGSEFEKLSASTKNYIDGIAVIYYDGNIYGFTSRALYIYEERVEEVQEGKFELRFSFEKVSNFGEGDSYITEIRHVTVFKNKIYCMTQSKCMVWDGNDFEWLSIPEDIHYVRCVFTDEDFLYIGDCRYEYFNDVLRNNSYLYKYDGNSWTSIEGYNLINVEEINIKVHKS